MRDRDGERESRGSETERDKQRVKRIGVIPNCSARQRSNRHLFSQRKCVRPLPLPCPHLHQTSTVPSERRREREGERERDRESGGERETVGRERVKRSPMQRRPFSGGLCPHASCRWYS